MSNALVRRLFPVVVGSCVLLIGACSSSSGGDAPPASGESAGSGGGVGSAGAAGGVGTAGAGAGAGKAGAAGGAGAAGAPGGAGSGGAPGCVPKPKIVACWVGDASMPPGPGTKSPSRCREYTGDDGSGPKQWDASCHPDSLTHAIDACPAGFTSRCVTNCGKTTEFVDYNYDGGGSQLICEGSGAVWLMP